MLILVDLTDSSNPGDKTLTLGKIFKWLAYKDLLMCHLEFTTKI